MIGCEGSPGLPQENWNLVKKLTRKLLKLNHELWRTLSLSWHRSQRFFRFMTWLLCCTNSIESRAWIEAKTRRARRFLSTLLALIGKLLISFQFYCCRDAARVKRYQNAFPSANKRRLKIWKNQLPKDNGWIHVKDDHQQSCMLMHHKTHPGNDFSSFLHAVDIVKKRIMMTKRKVTTTAIKMGIWESFVSASRKGLKSFHILFCYFRLFTTRKTAQNFINFKKRVRKKLWNYLQTKLHFLRFRDWKRRIGELLARNLSRNAINFLAVAVIKIFQRHLKCFMAFPSSKQKLQLTAVNLVPSKIRLLQFSSVVTSRPSRVRFAILRRLEIVCLTFNL